MAELVHHMDIDRAPEPVFAVASDPTRFAEWQADVAGARGVEGGPNETGATLPVAGGQGDSKRSRCSR